MVGHLLGEKLHPGCILGKQSTQHIIGQPYGAVLLPSKIGLVLSNSSPGVSRSFGRQAIGGVFVGLSVEVFF
jgi:hypothetical protein